MTILQKNMSDDFGNIYSDNKWPKVLQLYLSISQYPALSHTIRQRMRDELFARGIVTPEAFEEEVRQKAISSQRREGIDNPLSEESPADWDKRVRYIRAHLTDFYFAYNLPNSLFENIINQVIQRREPNRLVFNPELAPWETLLAEGERYEAIPPSERGKVEHQLHEIIAVLIKALISDNPIFVTLAKKVFTINDLKQINARRLGRGKIGGKAAGLLLAWKLLQNAEMSSDIPLDFISIPDSYYIGSDVFFEVHELNDFHAYMNQKYRTREEIIAEVPAIREDFAKAKLPEYIVNQLRELLNQIGQSPLICRSSSLLESSFSTPFTNKYDSFFLPNNGSSEDNLQKITHAILMIYASAYAPDALLCRQRLKLVDFDERIAVLIQKVAGTRHDKLFFPLITGRAFSKSSLPWALRPQHEDGVVCMVLGLGSHVADSVMSDCPNLIALRYSPLEIENETAPVQLYRQKMVNVIDLETNKMAILPIPEVPNLSDSALHFIASNFIQSSIQPSPSYNGDFSSKNLVVAFDKLLQEKRLHLLPRIKLLLEKLENSYENPFYIEFALDMVTPHSFQETTLYLLQCSPMKPQVSPAKVDIPIIPESDRVFIINQQVFSGSVEDVRYLVYVNPKQYVQIPGPAFRLDISRIIGQLNVRLKDENFILMGPGHWGSSDVNLGLKIAYSDIDNAKMLIGLDLPPVKETPNSMAIFGTRFFQSLVETSIYSLQLCESISSNFIRSEFIENSANHLVELLPKTETYENYIKVIDIPSNNNGRYLHVVMIGDRTVGYLDSSVGKTMVCE